MPSPTCSLQPPGEWGRLLEPAIRRSGLELAADASAAEAIIWCSPRPDGLTALVAGAANVRWVQLPLAGVERFLPLVRSRHDGIVWTSATEAYGPAVAEFALGLLMAGFRRLDRYSIARSWQPVPGRLLSDAHVVILGAGAIGRALVSLLGPAEAAVTVVSRSGTPVTGARAIRPEGMMDAVPTADAVVVAVPLTDATAGLVDRRFLSSMRDTAWLVNVARGPIVVTDDLVDALRQGVIGGAALDVTDPEPLPDGHPLWELDNALITPHVANTAATGMPALARLVEENARRFAAGIPLHAVIDPVAGY